MSTLSHIARSCVIVTGALALGSCLIAYPARRTYFEPTRGEGRQANWDLGSYLITKDAVEVPFREHVYVAVSVSAADGTPQRHVWIEVARYAGNGHSVGTVDPTKVRLNGLPPATAEHPKPAQWHLTFESADRPPPDRVEVTFDAGALTIGDHAQPIGPLHFNRVTRTGLRAWPG